MTILEKLQTYESATLLLSSLNDYGWPKVTQFLNLEGVSSKIDGKKYIQAWFDTETGWKIVKIETWTELDGNPKSERVITDELTAIEANSYIERELS